MPYYVYILTNNFGSVLYVGMTNNLERRMYEHREELIEGFSKKYHTHKLLYFEETSDVLSAITREKQIKGYSREKKERLIDTMNLDRKDLFQDYM